MSGETWRDYDLLISRIILISVLIFAVSLIWIFYLRHEVKSRKKAELMLDEQLQFIQTLSDSMPPALYVRDKKGVLISCNRSYLDSLGLKKENVLGKTAKQLPQIISESASEFHDAYFQAMQDGQTVVSVRCMHLLGKEVWVEHWIQPYRDSHGLIQGVICGWIDITEYRKVVRKLEAANKEADDASRAKTNFVATMSHEIRTPMSAIISILELELKRSSNSYIDRSSIEIAHNSAKNLLELIGEILDIARIESGRLSICPKRANVYELIEAVARVFEGLAAQKSLKLILDIDVSINTDVLIDAMRFKQILSNLVSNAIKFTEEGYVKISAIGNFIDTSKLSVKMTVEDSGAGICQADQKKLFHPFSQVSNNIHNTNGAGLGLVICRSLCEMMGGKINVVSELGRGTKVEYELFFSTLDKTIEPIRLPIFQPGLPRLRLQVLIVDDHKVNRTVLQQQLSFLGHDVIEAEDGSQAFNAWLDQDFDIIITDCHMPIMNGVQLTASIREAEAVKGDDPVIIIGLTADAQAEEVQMCIDAGMNDCLIKPIELEKLEALLSLSQTQLDNYTNISGDSELLASDKATDNPLLDSNILDFLRQTDSTMLSKILRELVLSNRLDVDQLKSLAKNLNLNLNSILELSHRMKGAARMVGCHILVDSCNDLESECLSSNPDNVKINLKIEKIVRVVFELESLIECMSLQG
jgi:two-component system sensor histidine kinase EvgS